jgi:hypothetical protein
MFLNTQRGIPFDPAAASAFRRKKAETIDKLRLHADATKPESPQRQHARYLDQVESAWRERARDRR